MAEKKPTAPAVPAPPKVENFCVAEGKSITCLKGVLVEGDEVKVDYIGGGKESFDKLIKDGYVVKAKEK